MKTLIIDYGMSNLGSISRAVEECGGSAVVSDSPESLKEAAKVILPGVGSFRDGMINLDRVGWVEPLKKTALNGIPILGICLGMQLLADEGDEGGKTNGLGIVAGSVTKLKIKAKEDRLPHVGWNEVRQKKECALFDGIKDSSDFYFVHSYHFDVKDKCDILAVTPYCGEFVSAIKHNNIYGVQFHPEKSSVSGFQLLKNFLNI